MCQEMQSPLRLDSSKDWMLGIFDRKNDKDIAGHTEHYTTCRDEYETEHHSKDKKQVSCGGMLTAWRLYEDEGHLKIVRIGGCCEAFSTCLPIIESIQLVHAEDSPAALSIFQDSISCFSGTDSIHTTECNLSEMR